jgi:hypothetical protein
MFFLPSLDLLILFKLDFLRIVLAESAPERSGFGTTKSCNSGGICFGGFWTTLIFLLLTLLFHLFMH